MSEFYNLYIAEWNVGTDDLGLEQEAAYLRIVNAINLYDQPIRDNLFVLCGMWRCGQRKAKRLRQDLIDAKKIWSEGGLIFNERAVNDVSTRRVLRVERASTGRRGGIESGKSRRKPLKNKDTGEAVGSTRIEENRIEESDDDAGARSRDESIFDEIVKMAKVDVSKSAWLDFNVSAAMLRWRALDLTDEEILTTIRAVVGKRRDPSPVGSPAYFDNAIQIAAGQKHRPALKPIDSGGSAHVPIPQIDIEKILKKRETKGD